MNFYDAVAVMMTGRRVRYASPQPGSGVKYIEYKEEGGNIHKAGKSKYYSPVMRTENRVFILCRGCGWKEVWEPSDLDRKEDYILVE